MFFNKINTLQKVKNPSYNKSYASVVIYNPRLTRYFMSNGEKKSTRSPTLQGMGGISLLFYK